MKTCPNCGKTFDDAMKFCQSDGTPLTVDAPEESDPFKTIVVSSQEAAGDAGQSPEKMDAADNISEVDDAMKTMVVSDEERREMMGGDTPKPPDFPAPPDLPKFDEPDLQSPSFGDLSGVSSANEPPNLGSSPFAADDKTGDGFDDEPPTMMQNDFKPAIDSAPSGPIPSPFDATMPPGYQPPSTPPFQKTEPGKPETPSFQSPEPQKPEIPSFEPPQYKQPEPPSSPFGQTPFGNAPFEAADKSSNQPIQQQEWTPPPAPDANWQNQEIGANTPFQPPPANAGQNQTLAIVSLILGILSIPCCSWYLFGIAALVTGFLAKGKADKEPSLYGGRGMALTGIIMGGISILLGIIVTVLYLLGAFASLLTR